MEKKYLNNGFKIREFWQCGGSMQLGMRMSKPKRANIDSYVDKMFSFS